MRGKIAIGCVFVGVFFLVCAVLAQTWAGGQLKRTPIDVDTTTHLAGEATMNGETFDVRYTSVTKADSDKSTHDVVVFATSSCLVKDLPNVGDCVSADDPSNALLSASLDNFATDRVTALAVNDPDLLPADAVDHEGLVNKFPFDAAKKDYPYWMGILDRSEPAQYVRDEKILGVDVRHYRVSVENESAEVADGIDGLFTEQIDLFIEPRTGSIVNQIDHQVRTLTDGSPVLDLTVEFTDGQQRADVDDAKSNANLLHLATVIVPIVGYAVGIPLVIIGLVLLLGGGRRPRTPSPEREPVLASK